MTATTWRCGSTALVLVALILTCGCHGSARIELTSLSYSAIDPPTPHASRVSLPECYWWTDDDGHAWIAMRRVQPIPFRPNLEYSVQLSLRLEKLPAGRARNYLASRDELRGALRLGPIQARYSSLKGIVALYREPGDKLRGSMCIETARVISRLLGGWGNPARYLVQGTFLAVHDERRGREIAEATEALGWEREPRAETPPSRPASPSRTPDEADPDPRAPDE